MLNVADRSLTPAGRDAGTSPGFYAGLKLDALTVGPLPTFDAALNAARHEHGASATIYVIEAEPVPILLGPFVSRVDEVLDWIDRDNAGPVGGDSVLPPLKVHHTNDLADRLNRAVREWAEAHGIKPVGRALGAPRSMHAVVPHEVDSVTVTKLDRAGIIAQAVDAAFPAPSKDVIAPTADIREAARRLGSLLDGIRTRAPVIVVDEVDHFEPEEVRRLFGGPPLGEIAAGRRECADAVAAAGLCCADCRSPKRCADEGCNADPQPVERSRCSVCPGLDRCAGGGCLASIDDGCVKGTP